MTTAIFPGSFDPITIGHLHLIERAAALFDEVIVVVGYNPHKQTAFTLAERLQFVRDSTAHLPNVRDDSFTRELLVTYARRVGATVVVRGLRAAADYENELPQAQMNRRMYPALDTVFLFAAPADFNISSTRVRETLQRGSPIDALVPPSVAHRINADK